MFRVRVLLACLVVLTAPALAVTAGSTAVATDTASHIHADTTAHADADTTAHADADTTAHADADTTAHADADTTAHADAAVSIAGLYPNPVADGDDGEFVTLSVAPGTDLGPYALSDGERRVDLPNGSASGRVVITDAPELVRTLLDVPGTAANRGRRVRIVTVERGLDLSNAGERVRVLRGNRSVSVVRYGSAPEGERYDAATGRWQPLGATDFPVYRGGQAVTRTFVLPDAPAVPIETLRRAENRLLLAGYTLTSERVADALVAAHRRGVHVRVLIEGGPVGGMTRRQAGTLDRLARAGVPVRVLDGPGVRYQYHHAKYAVADDRAVVLTENWKPAGTGGRSSRGWGVVVRDPAFADRLATVFRADADWRDSGPWDEFREGRRFEPAAPANASFEPSFAPRDARASGTELLVAPDNAGGRVRALVGNASVRVRVVQVSIDRSFARTLVEAARRGVEVRVLLAGAWYVREDNRALADSLNRRADEEDLPLAVRLATPAGYEKIHAKGVLVDDDTVAFGSLNWNEHAATENREVVVVLHGDEPARYYGAVFAHDWAASASGSSNAGAEGKHPTSGLPAGVFGVVGIAVVLALVVARRIDFGDGGPAGAERAGDGGDVGPIDSTLPPTDLRLPGGYSGEHERRQHRNRTRREGSGERSSGCQPEVPDDGEHRWSTDPGEQPGGTPRTGRRPAGGDGAGSDEPDHRL